MTDQVGVGEHEVDSTDDQEGAELAALALPNEHEAQQISSQIRQGVVDSQLPSNVRLPMPGRYTTREGRRIERVELLPLIEDWESERDPQLPRLIVQGGNRYISEYLREKGAEVIDLKLMSIDKAPLHTQISTLLTAPERAEKINILEHPALSEWVNENNLAFLGTETRGDLIRLTANYTLSSPFQPVTHDEALADELEAATTAINNKDFGIINLGPIKELLAGTRLGQRISTGEDLSFLDDLFYRGRTLYSLGVLVECFGGDPRNVSLTTIACEQKSRDLESSHHNVLAPDALYPFENSIRTEQGYWQDTDSRYIFSDLGSYWEHLNQSIDQTQIEAVVARWDQIRLAWARNQLSGELGLDESLVQPLLNLAIYHAAHGLDIKVDKIVDQKGHKIGLSVPFAQVVDRFISQEEPVEERLAFKAEVRRTLAEIESAIDRDPEDYAVLVEFYSQSYREIDFNNLNDLLLSELDQKESPASPERMQVVQTLSDLLIRRLESQDKPLVVALNGVDASGKTRLTEEIATELEQKGKKVCVIHMDHFTNTSARRHTSTDPVENYILHTFDIDSLRDSFLSELKQAGRANAEFAHPDPRDESASVVHSYTVNSPDTVVIVEGVLLFRPELNDFFDVRIYLDIPIQQMLARAALRDVDLYGFGVLDKYRNKYIPAQELYLATARPHDIADIVIDNSDWSRPMIKKMKTTEG